MKLLSYGKDGGPDSKVFGFWLVEIKWLFSVVVLRFDEGSREVFHSHAFNAFTWWLWGGVYEQYPDGKGRTWVPSIIPKYTPRSCVHKVFGVKRTYALSFRGPWSPTWYELDSNLSRTTLTYGRKKL